LTGEARTPIGDKTREAPAQIAWAKARSPPSVFGLRLFSSA
jgi:hypothetical protein